MAAPRSMSRAQLANLQPLRQVQRAVAPADETPPVRFVFKFNTVPIKDGRAMFGVSPENNERVFIWLSRSQHPAAFRRSGELAVNSLYTASGFENRGRNPGSGPATFYSPTSDAELSIRRAAGGGNLPLINLSDACRDIVFADDISVPERRDVEESVQWLLFYQRAKTAINKGTHAVCNHINSNMEPVETFQLFFYEQRPEDCLEDNSIYLAYRVDIKMDDKDNSKKYVSFKQQSVIMNLTLLRQMFPDRFRDVDRLIQRCRDFGLDNLTTQLNSEFRPIQHISTFVNWKDRQDGKYAFDESIPFNFTGMRDYLQGKSTYMRVTRKTCAEHPMVRLKKWKNSGQYECRPKYSAAHYLTEDETKTVLNLRLQLRAKDDPEENFKSPWITAGVNAANTHLIRCSLETFFAMTDNEQMDHLLLPIDRKCSVVIVRWKNNRQKFIDQIQEFEILIDDDDDQDDDDQGDQKDADENGPNAAQPVVQPQAPPRPPAPIPPPNVRPAVAGPVAAVVAAVAPPVQPPSQNQVLLPANASSSVNSSQSRRRKRRFEDANAVPPGKRFQSDR